MDSVGSVCRATQKMVPIRRLKRPAILAISVEKIWLARMEMVDESDESDDELESKKQYRWMKIKLV